MAFHAGCHQKRIKNLPLREKLMPFQVRLHVAGALKHPLRMLNKLGITQQQSRTLNATVVIEQG